ncbi:MAG: DUF1634 domain-containing protein [Chloroflexota bacterium]
MTASADDFDRAIGRLLTVLTAVAVGLLVIGVVLMVVNGVSPLDPTPSFDPRDLVSQLVALEPMAFLWLGLVAVIVTPVSRVVAAGIGYARRGELGMAGIAVAILLVLAVAVVVGAEA